MIKLILIFVTAVFMYSCSSDKEEEVISDGSILSIDKFTNLMTDVQLLEGHLNTNRVNQVFIMDSSANYYKELFNQHEITLEDYKRNLKYYTAKPSVLADVYAKVEENLVIQERLYKDVLIDQPAISPINRNQLLKILASDTSIANLVLDTSFQYIEIKDSLFSYYSDSILKNHKTNRLSFQQSYNVSTHTKPLYRVFRNELKNKLEKIVGID